MSHRFELMVLRVRKLLDIPPQHPVHSLPTLRPISGRKPGRSQGKGKLKAASIPPASAGHVLIRGKKPPHQHPPANNQATKSNNNPRVEHPRVTNHPPRTHQTATQHRHRATQQPLQALPITDPSPSYEQHKQKTLPPPVRLAPYTAPHTRTRQSHLPAPHPLRWLTSHRSSSHRRPRRPPRRSPDRSLQTLSRNHHRKGRSASSGRQVRAAPRPGAAPWSNDPWRVAPSPCSPSTGRHSLSGRSQVFGP